MSFPTKWVADRFARRLRFPYLFGLTAILFVINLVVPDPIPFIDELMLGLLAALFAMWKEERRELDDEEEEGELPEATAGTLHGEDDVDPEPT